MYSKEKEKVKVTQHSNEAADNNDIDVCASLRETVPNALGMKRPNRPEHRLHKLHGPWVTKVPPHQMPSSFEMQG